MSRNAIFIAIVVVIAVAITVAVSVCCPITPLRGAGRFGAPVSPIQTRINERR